MKGFTLGESIIVLSVCVCFLLLPVLKLENYIQTIESEQFLDSFEKKILYTQQMSIVMNRDTQILFDELNQKFTYIIDQDNEIIIVTVPDQLIAKGPSKIVFKQATGNNGNLSKYLFVDEKKQQIIEFQFQLGSGEFLFINVY